MDSLSQAVVIVRMSQIAPDLPEFRDVPHAARGILYMGALAAAIRSPAVVIAGAVLLVLAPTIGATQGYRALGILGAAIGVLLGVVAAAGVFYKIVLPWQARRLLVTLLRGTDPRTYQDIGRTSEAIARMAGAYRQRESGQTPPPPSPEDK